MVNLWKLLLHYTYLRCILPLYLIAVFWRFRSRASGQIWAATVVDNSPGKWLQGKLDSLELDLVEFLLMKRLVCIWLLIFLLSVIFTNWSWIEQKWKIFWEIEFHLFVFLQLPRGFILTPSTSHLLVLIYTPTMVVHHTTASSAHIYPHHPSSPSLPGSGVSRHSNADVPLYAFPQINAMPWILFFAPTHTIALLWD